MVRQLNLMMLVSVKNGMNTNIAKKNKNLITTNK